MRSSELKSSAPVSTQYVVRLPGGTIVGVYRAFSVEEAIRQAKRDMGTNVSFGWKASYWEPSGIRAVA